MKINANEFSYEIYGIASIPNNHFFWGLVLLLLYWCEQRYHQQLSNPGLVQPLVGGVVCFVAHIFHASRGQQ